MISGIGIDLIEVQRIREAIAKYGDRFLNRIYTKVEIEYCSTKKSAELHYAGRFAAKEAAFKAMERGWGGDISWKEIEIHNETSGAPRVVHHSRLHAMVVLPCLISRDLSKSLKETLTLRWTRGARSTCRASPLPRKKWIP